MSAPTTFPFGGQNQVTPADMLPSLFHTTVGNEMAPDGVGLRQPPMGWFRRPDGSDDERLRGYRVAGMVTDLARHKELLQKQQGGTGKAPPSDQFWIPVDLGGMLTRLMRHYTFGRDFRLEATVAGADETLVELVSGMRMIPKFRQASEEGSAYGDAVFKLAIEDIEDDEGNVVPQPALKFIAPWHYFPEVDPMDAERVTRVTLAWVVPRPDDIPGKDEWLVIREIHDPGRIEYRLNFWDGAELGDSLGHGVLQSLLRNPELEQVVETGINEIPIVHIAAGRQAGHHFGRSELPRIARIITALENRMAQEDEVLQKHARPKLIVGPGSLDEEGKAPLLEHYDVIEVDPGLLEKSVQPSYLTWDMQIQGIEHQIEKLEEWLFVSTETSPASFGLERDGSQVESARALKFKAHRTVNKVNDYRDEWTPAVRDVVRIAQKLWNAALAEDGMDERARTGVRIVWGDAIIEDDTQEATDYSLLKTSGLVSRRRAVRDLFNLTDAEAQAEVGEILQDSVDESAAAAVGRPAPAPPGAEDAAPPDEEPAPGEGEVTPDDEA